MKHLQRARGPLATLLELCGVGCVVLGVALFSVPVALIVGGLLLVFLARGVVS